MFTSTHGKKGPGINKTRGWVHPTAGLDIEEKSKTPAMPGIKLQIV